MPTKLDRVQVLFQKDIFKKLKLIAKIERRSLSSMVGSIVQDAIQSSKYQVILSKAKAEDLKSKVDEGKLLIKDILKPQITSKEDFDMNSKLERIDAILSLISESNKDEIVELKLKDILEPSTDLEKINSTAGEKLKKLRLMIAKTQNINNLQS